MTYSLNLYASHASQTRTATKAVQGRPFSLAKLLTEEFPEDDPYESIHSLYYDENSPRYVWA